MLQRKHHDVVSTGSYSEKARNRSWDHFWRKPHADSRHYSLTRVGTRLFNPVFEPQNEQNYTNRSRDNDEKSDSSGTQLLGKRNEPAKSSNPSVQYSNNSGEVGHLTRSFRTLGLSLENRRILVLTGFRKNSSMSSILSKIAGGPLERIVLNEWREKQSVELFFVHPEKAQKFYLYGQTCLFQLEKNPLSLEWADERNTKDINMVHPSISQDVMSHIRRGARRSLLFVKNIPNKPTRKHSHYPEPEKNFSTDFKITSVFSDFGQFGRIIEITPVISRKLSFCIHFSDVREAISVKKHCATKGTRLASKYSEWYIYYGKDPTDRPFICN